MNKIILLNIKELRPHEEIDPIYFEELKNKVLKMNYWKWPIVVEKDLGIVLDGHHRYKIAKALGFKKIPALVVDYNNLNIRVLSRRDEIEISKESVIDKVNVKELFPKKTTNHQALIDGSWESIYKIAPETEILFSELK